MSFEDIVSSVGANVRRAVSGETADPATLRAPVLAQLKRAESAWGDGQSQSTGDWFSRDNDLVAFTPTLAGGAPLTIDGQTTVFVPADRFAAYLAAMRAQVEAGAFDAEIAGGLSGSPNVSGLATVPMPEAEGGNTEGSGGDRVS
ncbi:hypothetical protein [Sphingomonas radiodurans]|uniref:hypothetical protein n=1 Tax=Sphingomonas radiodurans TaxID=2890321 RepID=UPI001E64B16D|nr:hypothetical protein [Sphingomonas radiodurans]WBH18094.1 hypothetical protein LLW23_08380 [Sphingomonas radiodurans]